VEVKSPYCQITSSHKVVLRNFEGVITTYPKPENYVPGKAEDYFKNVYPDMNENDLLLEFQA
jgi:lysine 2,3-aminomutase